MAYSEAFNAGFPVLIKYEFHKSTLFDEAGIEMDLYQSEDFESGFITQRACLENVLKKENIDQSPERYSDITLDQLLLDFNVYVIFIDE